MGEIKITEKPEKMDFNLIHNVLWHANVINRKNGFVLTTSLLNPEDLKTRLGNNGKCFIALDGEKVVGTISVRFVERKKWYYSGILPDYMLAGVLPEYQGKHINSKLAEKVFDHVRKYGFPAIELDTAENNTHAIQIYLHQGFIPVDFIAKANLDHYSVIMIKWFDRRPYSLMKTNLYFKLKRMYVKLRYKTGRIKRFGI